MSQGEFRPDLRPLFKWDETSGAWVPDIDEATGRQRVVGVETRHPLPWPGDSSVSSITDRSWFSLSTAWQTDIRGSLWYLGRPNADGTPRELGRRDFVLKWDVRWEDPGGVPAGTVMITVKLPAGRTESVGWCWEKKAK